MSRRRLQRWATLLSGAALSAACLVPEYGIATDGSGGGSSDESGGTGSDGSDSGGTQSNSGGNSPGSGGQSSGGNTSTGGNAEGGMGGVPANWSCADEESSLPDYYSNDVLCGYRFTFSYPETDPFFVDPPCTDEELGTDCFRSGHEVVKANIPADAGGVYHGVAIGMRVAQPSGNNNGPSGAYELEGYGLSLDYVSDGSVRLAQVQLKSGSSTYCVDAAPGASLAWSDFRKDCYNRDYPDTLSAGDLVQEVHVALLGTDVAQTITNFDILDIDMLDAAAAIDCDGCAELFTPLEGVDSSKLARFELAFGSGPDLSDTLLRLHLLIETAGNSGGFLPYFVDANGYIAFDYWRHIGDYKGWIYLHVDPTALDPDNPGSDSEFDPNLVQAFGIQVSPSGTDGAGFVQADTTIHLDAIEFESPPSGLSDITFDDDVAGWAVVGNIPGSTISHEP